MTTDLTRAYPALEEWRQWGMTARPLPDASRRRPASARLRLSYVPACASSQSARLVKPTITASIQYCERTASLAFPP